MARQRGQQRERTIRTGIIVFLDGLKAPDTGYFVRLLIHMGIEGWVVPHCP